MGGHHATHEEESGLTRRLGALKHRAISEVRTLNNQIEPCFVCNDMSVSIEMSYFIDIYILRLADKAVNLFSDYG